jgi:hypothetical protein
VEEIFNRTNMEEEMSIDEIKYVVRGRETMQVAGAPSVGDIAHPLGNIPTPIT